MRAVGEGTMEGRKAVERPWVITIALTGPNRRDRDALTIPASPIVRFETARRGPLYASGTPYLRKSQAGARGRVLESIPVAAWTQGRATGRTRPAPMAMFPRTKDREKAASRCSTSVWSAMIAL